MRRSWSQVYLPVAAVAAVLRCWAAVALAGSPLRNFHLVPGLDMQTLLERGEWGATASPLFTLHRMLVAFFWSVNGRSHQVMQLAGVQLVLGVVAALLTAWIVLHLFGSRRYALAAGMVAALYGPALMYECTMLQESMVTFACLAAVVSLIRAHRLHWGGGAALASGVLFGLATIGRPTALLLAGGAVLWFWLELKRRNRLRRWWTLPGGILVVWILIGGLNWHYSRNWSPFFNVLPYSASVNTGGETPSSAVPEEKAVFELPPPVRIGINAVGRLPVLFGAHEVPDNLNYYFIREMFPPLRISCGPWLVLPLAAAGMVLLLFSGRWKRRDGLLLGVILLLMLPLCANYPMGRYRLLLYPYLSILAVYPAWWALRCGPEGCRKRTVWMLAAVAGSAGLNLALSERPFVRGSDFVAWAVAMEEGGKRVSEASLQTFEQGLAESGFTEQAALVNLMVRLIPAGQLDRAEGLLAKAFEAGAIEPALLWYYGGLVKLGQGRFDAAAAALERSDPARLGILASKRSFFEGEARRLKGDNAGAARCYRRALTEEPLPSFRPLIEEALKNLPETGRTTE